jgi:hypothetical protein
MSKTALIGAGVSNFCIVLCCARSGLPKMMSRVLSGTDLADQGHQPRGGSFG